MKFIFSKTILITVLFISGIIIISGCRKQKDTIAKIYVKDSSNNFVGDCEVILYGVSTTGNQSAVELEDTLYTNSAGVAVFNFNNLYKAGMAGVAVLNIKATKDGHIGHGIIKVEEEVTNEETVFLQN
jgi:hypothetical protein